MCICVKSVETYIVILDFSISLYKQMTNQPALMSDLPTCQYFGSLAHYKFRFCEQLPFPNIPHKIPIILMGLSPMYSFLWCLGL